MNKVIYRYISLVLLLIFSNIIFAQEKSVIDTTDMLYQDEEGVSFNLNTLKNKFSNSKLNSALGGDKGFNLKSIFNLFRNKDEENKSLRDTNLLAFPFNEKKGYEFSRNDIKKNLYLGKFPKANSGYNYDYDLKKFIYFNKYEKYNLRPSKTYSIADYIKYENKKLVHDSWVERSRHERQLGYKDFFKYASMFGLDANAFGGLFGSGLLQIKPTGSGELLFGIKNFYSENPQIPEEQRNQTILDFKQNIQISANATIGSKFKIGFNFNTETSFDFENQININFKGGEDDLLQDIKIGNVTFPKVGSLISAPSSLFGIRLDLKFGYLYVTTVLSEQKGEIKSVRAESGASIKKIEIKSSEYEEDKHFFLSKYFRDGYENSLANLPFISSGVTINRIEVWITNKRGSNNNSRNILAFVDLAENKYKNLSPNSIGYITTTGYGTASNLANTLYETIKGTNNIRSFFEVSNALKNNQLKSGEDYEKVENARLLNNSEYIINKQLGYISLKSPIRSDEILAVAYEYVYNGQTFKVGELSNAGIQSPKTLLVKLIKGSNFNPEMPTWNLMMRNIYSLNDYQVSSKDFKLNIYYEDNNSGADALYLPVVGQKKGYNNKQLLELLNLDNTNAQNTPGLDGNFDFLEGVTVNSNNGSIIIPALEPFGDWLAGKIYGKKVTDQNRGIIYNDVAVKKYTYRELYTKTKKEAKQKAKKNKFIIKAKYKSEGVSGIPLNSFNVKRGSVKVTTAEGLVLKENLDFTVDYTRGIVKIINPIYSAPGVALNVTSESNSMFNQQTKTFFGTRLNYKPNDKFNLGGTMMYYSEKPLTQKVNTGSEPISNMIFGLDGKYSDEIYAFTKAVNFLPNIETKTKSNYNIEAEFAYLLPGISSGIKGVSYIDDFEASESYINLKDIYSWELSSTPVFKTKYDNSKVDMEYDNDLEYGFNRAKLAWYDISYYMNYDNSSKLPSGVDNRDRATNYTRYISRLELYPNKDQQYTSNSSINMLDLAFYPEERGPYNFDVKGVNKGGVVYSAGLDISTEYSRKLLEPATRWGGIMRNIPVTNFEKSNIEYLEFWMMDPFLDRDIEMNEDGRFLYINLGEISEDILKDSRKSAEQNLPPTGLTNAFLDSIPWGQVSSKQSVNKSFDNNPESRKYQDVGLDGISSEKERSFFADYLDDLRNYGVMRADVFQEYKNDPSNDDYKHFKDNTYKNIGILERYKNYNGQEGNSVIYNTDNSNVSATTKPNTEDINDDNTLNERNDYYEYRIELKHDMPVGSQYIIDKKTTSVKRFGITVPKTIWYKFRIPINRGVKIGNISDFTSIRFIRLYLKGFEKPVICRFASLNLVRSNWKKYEYHILDSKTDNKLLTSELEDFEVSAVNIEQNESKKPVNYVLPPGIQREKDLNNENIIMRNEQSLALKVIDLPDNQARGVYKEISVDMRRYRKLLMEVHAEAISDGSLYDNDLKVFIRIGSDITENYYEYEQPLKVTPPAPSGQYSSSQADRKIVWPEINRIELNLKELTNAKLERNKKYRLWRNEDGIRKSYSDIYTKIGPKPQSTITVKGSPSISEASMMVIGIRNPKDNSESKSCEMWVNELRLTDFDNNGGWASKIHLSTNIADFSKISISASYLTPGFGTIDERSFDRSQEEVLNFSLATTFSLGKLFPASWKLKFPLNANYANKIITPEYDPFDEDVKVADRLEYLTPDEKEDYNSTIEDKTTRRGISISQLKLNLGENNVWSPKNFSALFSYNDVYITTPEVDYDRQYNVKIGFNYTWSSSSKNFYPFKNISFLKSKYFGLINGFHINYTPSSIYFKTLIDRDYREFKPLNISDPDLELPLSFQKRLDIINEYGFTFNPMRHFKFKFSAKSNSLAEEDSLKMNWDDRSSETTSLIIDNYLTSRLLKYNHDLKASYRVPFNRIPFLKFITVNTAYSSKYNWEAAQILPPALSEDKNFELGNTISNSNKISISPKINFVSIYNFFPFIKKIKRKKIEKIRSERKPRYKTIGSYKKNELTFRLKRPLTIKHRLGTKDVDVIVTSKDGKKVKGIIEVLDKNTITFTTPITYKEASIEVIGKIQTNKFKSNLFDDLVFEPIVNFITMLKSVSVLWEETNASILPGYTKDASWLGMDNFNAPGWKFASGWVEKDFALNATKKGWVTLRNNHNSPYLVKKGERISYRIKLEPFSSLKISIKGSKQESSMYSTYIRKNNSSWEFGNEITSGTHTISAIFINTAFDKIKINSKGEYTAKVIENIKNNLLVVANRIADGREQSDPNYIRENTTSKDLNIRKYPDGYTSSSQDVLIPSFIAAYSGESASSINLSAFMKFPVPNWNITYSGLSNIDFIKKYIGTISLSHAYSGEYSTGSYKSNLDYNSIDGYATSKDISNENYVTENNFSRLSITEKFNPLLGVDIKLVNDIDLSFNYNKARNANLSLSNQQITHIQSYQISFGVGYTITDLPIFLTTSSGNQTFKNDIKVDFTFSIRDDQTHIYKIIENYGEIISGKNIISIKSDLDYSFNENLSLKLYFDYVANEPKRGSFNTSTTKFGIGIKYSIN